jgi:ribose/xylose/arabinose/galactoside ABC-type transport system permease subunit
MGSSTFSLFLGIAMLAVFALVLGGVSLLRGGKDRKRGWLMLAAAFVLLGNVLIWTV